MNKLYLLLVLVTLTSCFNEPVEVGTVEGRRPIYITEEANFVEILGSRSFGELGKIVYAAPYLLINERFQGIHVLDNTDPSNPQKINFIQIPGNIDFTVKNGFLYANHGSDLAVFQFGVESSQLGLGIGLDQTCLSEDFFTGSEDNIAVGLYPPNYEGFFECVDPDKGIVINWETTTLTNPECRI